MKLPNYILQKQNSIIFHEETVINETNVHIDTFSGYMSLVIDKESTFDLSVVIGMHSNPLSLEFHILEGAKAKLTISHMYMNKSETKLQFFLEKNTDVQLIEFISNTKPTKSSLSRQFSFKDHSKLSVISGLFFDGSFQLIDEFSLNGESSMLTYEMLNIGSNIDEIFVKQNVNHLHKNSVSNITNLLVASNQAKLNYEVTGFIEKGMYSSSCKQQNRGLILGEFGQIKVDPKLLINEFDVEASHGAAIGQINDDELFYLLSRGLTDSSAKELIVSGYTMPFINLLEPGLLKKKLIKKIANKIQGVTS